MKGVVISIANEKGGVGKTALTTNLAAALSRVLTDSRNGGVVGASERESVPILVIDNDPQGGTTLAFDFEDVSEEQSLYRIYKGQAETLDPSKAPSVEEIIVPTAEAGVWLVPAHLRMAKTGREVASSRRPDLLLNRAISHVRSKYPVTLIDTSPSLDTLTVNALAASDFVLVPCETETPSLKGLADLLDTISEVVHPDNRLNSHLRILGLLPTRVAHNAVSDAVLNYFKSSDFVEQYPQFSGKVLTAQMTDAAAYRDARYNRLSVFRQGRSAKVRQYQDEMLGIAREVLERVQEEMRNA